MSALAKLEEDEAYLLAILDDATGIDLAEFAFVDEENDDRCYRVWDYQWCLRGDTLMYTDRGRRKIKDVVGQVRLLTAGKGERGQWVDARVEAYAPAETWKIAVERRGVQRNLYATAGHRWFASSERQAERRRHVEVATEDLQPGQWLRTTLAPAVELVMERGAIQAGIVHGDGSAFGGRSRVLLFDDKRSLARFFEGPGTVPPSNPTALYFGRLPAEYKTLRPDVATSHPSVLWGWLAGYFATDGSIGVDGSCAITSVDIGALAHVRDVATAVGVVVSGIGHRYSADSKGDGHSYSVLLRAQDLPEEFFLRPFHHERRQAIAQRPVRSAAAWKVVSVEATGKVEDVYCAVVEGTHSFVLDGDILTGNSLYTNESVYQADLCGRSLGKSQGIIMRAFAFPFCFPGQELLITAPELNHLRPVTDKVEALFTAGPRFAREMLPRVKGNGINHQPQFQARFANNARIVSRLPNRDGRGVKGQHPLRIEMDECFPAGTLVTTRRGQVPIQDVTVGDQVLTRRNRWRAVTDTMAREREVVRVRGQGHPGLVASVHHKFWASRGGRRLVRDGGAMVMTDTFDKPDYVPAIELEGAHWSSPTTFPKTSGGKIPALRVGRRPTGYAPAVDVRAASTWWMVGLYLAEGSVGRASASAPLTRLTFSIHRDEAPEVMDRLQQAGLTPSGPYPIKSGAGVNVVCYSGVQELVAWLTCHFGRGAHHKQIASWALGLPRAAREQLLGGLIYGDGFHDGDARYADGRMKLTTVSKALAVSSRLLALSLGYSVGLYWSDLSQREVIIRGRSVNSKGFYQVVFNPAGQGFDYDHKRFTAVREVTRLDRVETLYDLTVEEDHSFIADGLIVSNSQDFPAPGWTEIIETMKSGSKGAQWRAHGVSRGVRDMYYRITMGEDPALPFYVHKYMAPHRATWSDEERRAKLALYGGTEENVDYRRNIFGEHGDAHNPLFVLARLMACVRINESDWATQYNDELYYKVKINDELHRRSGLPIENFLLDIPGTHLDAKYSSYWAGMDVGFTVDPSEILIFGTTGDNVDRLLTRVQLARITASDQAAVVRHLFSVYGTRLRRFGMDKTGNGLPLWQNLREDVAISSRIAGYGFSEKLPVAFDDRAPVGKEGPADLTIDQNVIDFATDQLRRMVDTKALELPYDTELLTEWQGQAVTVVKDSGSAAGIRKRYSGGACHTLSAAQMYSAAKNLQAIEAALAAPARRGPVLEAFV